MLTLNDYCFRVMGLNMFTLELLSTHVMILELDRRNYSIYDLLSKMSCSAAEWRFRIMLWHCCAYPVINEVVSFSSSWNYPIYASALSFA